MTKVSLAILATLAVTGCGPSAQPSRSVDASDPLEIRRIAGGYRQYALMTPNPVVVESRAAAMCASVAPSDAGDARARYGPHADTAVNIYMNDSAAHAFAGRLKQYPVGSVIVKEKTAVPSQLGDDTAQASHGHSGVGGMIKRPVGYDRSHGDWEYFYYEDRTQIDSGRLASCVRCHAAAASGDYVFGDWSGQPKSSAR